MEKRIRLKEEVKETIKHKRNVKRGRNAKRKGGQYERIIAKKLGEAFGVELKRTPQSGGFAKSNDILGEFRGDISVIDKVYDFLLHVECKNQKTWSLPSWIRQAEEDCPESKIPTVIFHKDGTSKDYICLDLEHFLSLVNKSAVVKKR